MTKHICKNYGSCGKADARESIALEPGAEPLCDECGFKLEPVESEEDKKSKKKLAIGAAIGVVLIGIVVVGYLAADSAPASNGVSSPASAPVSANTASPQSTGLSPDEKTLASQKSAADTKIIEAGGVGAALGQKVVIAKEYVKAAIPLMQAGKWREAEEQLLKAKSENPDEPLVYYNMAITQLKQSQAKEALLSLETAFKKGFKDFGALEADADLKPLTNKPEYKVISAQFKNK